MELEYKVEIKQEAPSIFINKADFEAELARLESKGYDYVACYVIMPYKAVISQNGKG